MPPPVRPPPPAPKNRTRLVPAVTDGLGDTTQTVTDGLGGVVKGVNPQRGDTLTKIGKDIADLIKAPGVPLARPR